MIKEGDKAPAFKGKDQDGNTVMLEDFKEKKLVLFFYPKDNTPGCTKEACNLRDNYEDLKKAGFKLLGVSIDSDKSHINFISKFDLPFPLLADTEKEIVNEYGVWREKNMYGRKYMGTYRTTFIINEAGIIEKIFKKVDTSNHAAQIMDTAGV